MIGWIAMKLDAGIHDAQRMNPQNFSNPLTFPVAPQAGQSFYIFCIYWTGKKVSADNYHPAKVNTLVIPWFFL